MKIQMKINFKIIFFILFSTFVYAEDINHSLNLALKDSLVDISKIDSKFQNQPEYIFLNALIALTMCLDYFKTLIHHCR